MIKTDKFPGDLASKSAKTQTRVMCRETGVQGAVLLFSKLNQILLGYFDPNVVSCNYEIK